MKSKKVIERIEFLTFINVLILVGCTFFCGIAVGTNRTKVSQQSKTVPQIRIIPNGANSKKMKSQNCLFENEVTLPQLDRLFEI